MYGELDDVVLGFANQAFTTGHTPDRWKTLMIVTVPMSWNLSNPNNFLVMKLYNRSLTDWDPH